MKTPIDPLEVDKEATLSNEFTNSYEITHESPVVFTPVDFKKRRSSTVYSSSSTPSSTSLPAPAPTQSSPTSGPQPTTRLLFSLVSRRQFFILLLPAFISSITAGGIAPFMTFVIGQSFDAFARFPLTSPSQSDKDTLLHNVGLAALELVGLAVGSLALSSVESCLWIWNGEVVVRELRRKVYRAVVGKDMVWFDCRMGAESSVITSEDDGPIGAGGLMAKFTRETDDVRQATSLSSGYLLQYLTTTIACLILAFMRAPLLTLVILSAVPLLILIQGLSQAFASPHLANERNQTAQAATAVDRSTSAIATVKAFNARAYEELSLSKSLDRISASAKKCNSVWGFTSSLSQFVMMAMFVQGFWFGARLVKSGKNSAGDVMAVFWACLIATSNLQMCIPQFITLAKGKFAMASLLGLVESEAQLPAVVRTRKFSNRQYRRPTYLKKITPSRCAGELALHNLSFAYPSRPTMPVLDNVSLYLPAREMTFIVGGSGSGKSTIASLLLGLYAPQEGTIALDDQDLHYLSSEFTKRHIAGVSQTSMVFDMSVHDNVALGKYTGPNSRPVTRDEVVEACRAALMHDFVRDLPEGYDTKLGTGGANLSGGQKQRLAIARAKLRDPTVLILDEATSALDATSRLLVFEAIKRWRAHKTTVVITHDLSQITSSDFVYVLKGGQVVEQGYRYDLEAGSGEFSEMMESQGGAGGYLPEKRLSFVSDELEAEVEKVLEEVEEEKRMTKRMTLKEKRVTFGNWMFEAIQDLTVKDKPTVEKARLSRLVPAESFAKEMKFNIPRRPSSIHIGILPPPVEAHTPSSRRFSLQFAPTSPEFNRQSLVSDDLEFDVEKRVLKNSSSAAALRRVRNVRTHWDNPKMNPSLTSIQGHSTTSLDHGQEDKQLGFWALMREIYPTVPYKPVIALGLFICILSGAMTPIFSFLLSRLMFEVSIGARNTPVINLYGGIVLAMAAMDGILIGLKYFVMETTAMAWVTKIRKECFTLVLSQDKTWFDRPQNSPVRLTQILIKDGDDARTLIATVLGQTFVVIAMLGVGLIWALVQGWQLTLVGFAIAPVFAVTMAVQSSLVAGCEVRNKRAREDVAKGYYEAISNIKGIRSMNFEGIFQAQFDKAADLALSTGVRGAFVEGCTYGVASALIYLAEALLFYVGAVLIARGTYSYLQMVEVLNLVVFTVTIGSQLMAFTQRIAKALQATRDFNNLLRLSPSVNETRGIMKPVVTGHVSFNNVTFSYPERPDVPVLRDINMELADGECVAIVGASGSGKSTVAALLQRLYEPNHGSIFIGSHDIRSTDVTHLRDHVSVVSQNPNLFDSTIAENISYGNSNLTYSDIRRAAKAANVHDFIMTLPQGYDTMVGENASLISGGQAQRLSIARALARPSKILILDECTSALDPSNQAAVLETVRHAKIGRTTIMVTHKLQAMRMCDRILVIHDGIIAEHGTYKGLMEKNGIFAQLASGGEWSGL